jgi:hypothetical protein
MSRTFIPKAVRKRVAAEARYRCGYCQTQQGVIGMPLHIEHIIPEAVGGSSEIENLWLACPLCNNYKGTQTHAVDPVSGERILLFNPRTQDWHEHFEWSGDGIQVIGLTPTGRATVVALQLNRPFLLRARRRWVKAGWHPPADR